MRKLPALFLANVVAILWFVVPPVAAHSVSMTYETPTTPAVSLVCSPCVFSGFDSGGVIFPAIAEIPSSVGIVDVSTHPVAFTACQDTNGNGLCEVMGEPRVDGCGASSLAGSAVSFVAGVATAVFAYVSQPFACAGSLAATGTVTLTYAT